MLDPQQGRVISREVHCLITRRKDPAVPVGIVEVFSTHSAANRCTLQWCQAEHTLPDLTGAVDHRVLPPADNGSNPVAPNLTDAPSPYIPAALLPPVALALASSVVATTLNTPTHCYEWLPCLAPHPHAGKRLKTVTEEGGRGVAG